MQDRPGPDMLFSRLPPDFVSAALAPLVFSLVGCTLDALERLDRIVGTEFRAILMVPACLLAGAGNIIATWTMLRYALVRPYLTLPSCYHRLPLAHATSNPPRPGISRLVSSLSAFLFDCTLVVSVPHL